MRVNISYSVELEDVPQEIERILVDCDHKIRTIHQDLTQTIGKDPLTMIKELDEVRVAMAKADFQLDDCMQMLNGYVQTMARLPEMEHGSPPTTNKEESEDE